MGCDTKPRYMAYSSRRVIWGHTRQQQRKTVQLFFSNVSCCCFEDFYSLETGQMDIIDGCPQDLEPDVSCVRARIIS